MDTAFAVLTDVLTFVAVIVVGFAAGWAVYGVLKWLTDAVDRVDRKLTRLEQDACTCERSDQS
jgi:hypothetical protein